MKQLVMAAIGFATMLPLCAEEMNNPQPQDMKAEQQQQKTLHTLKIYTNNGAIMEPIENLESIIQKQKELGFNYAKVSIGVDRFPVPHSSGGYHQVSLDNLPHYLAEMEKTLSNLGDDKKYYTDGIVEITFEKIIFKK